ncbi:MAG: hypothetical protein KatS3mg008_1764 [Acidimicrobiales bacterium]|nr:MAG: hypothetical protein KatS3mg008_1764 [Acidimicrobiales bacterium]
MRTDLVQLAYRERLTDGDFEILAGACGCSAPAELRRRPDLLTEALASPAAERLLFGAGHDHAAEERLFVQASPFLVFAVAVHATARQLSGSRFCLEWVGLRQRVPVFDVPALTEFLDDPMRRLFLIELLTSFTHVVSGSALHRTRRGWRRMRWSELDPGRLATLVEAVDDRERPGVYRRLGDLSLFLTGVFPDHTARVGLRPIEAERLVRAAGLDARSVAEDLIGHGDMGAVGLLEKLGRRFYELAVHTLRAPRIGSVEILTDVADRFDKARRILNHITDRYLFPLRERLF